MYDTAGFRQFSAANSCQAWFDFAVNRNVSVFGAAGACVIMQMVGVTETSCTLVDFVSFGVSPDVCATLTPEPITFFFGRSVITDNFADSGGCPRSTCSVGDPVNPGTGNNFIVETDYESGTVSPLRFVRTFNSQQLAPISRVGRNWRHNYERSVNVNTTNDAASVLREDNKVYVFRLVGSVWTPNAYTTDRLEQLASGWRYTTSNGDVVETYDVSGNLISIANRAGLTQTLAYSDTTTPQAIAPRPGLLIRVSDPFGRQLNFTYDGGVRIKTMSDPAGGLYSYTYDNETNNLLSVSYPDTQSPSRFKRTYSFDPGDLLSQNAGLFQGIIDENNQQYVTWQYDSLKRVVSSQHAGGADLVTISYANSSFFPTTITTNVDAGVSASRDYRFQTLFGVTQGTSIVGPACPSCGPTSQTYDANGNVSSRTGWNGNVTNYSYDLTRNLETSRTEAFGTPQARTVSTQWHATFRLPVKIAEPLRVTSYVYNGDAGASCGVQSDGVTLVPGVLCSKTIQPTTDATGAAGFGATAAGTPRTWTYAYNTNGSVLTMNGPRIDASDVTTYAYYPNNDPDFGKRGNVATIANALGHVTSINAYNAHGQPLTIVDPNGLTTTLTYDPRQRLTSRSVGGELTSYDYDGVGQLIKVTLPDASFLSYSYDAAHRLTGIADNLGNRIAYTLDIAGNRKQEQVFDPLNALAQTRSRVYNALNRLFQEIGAQNQTTQYAYDNQGNVTSIDGPLTGTVDVTVNTYDALNRLVRVTDPNLGQTQYAFNGIDQLVGVTDPRNLATNYNYDGLANLNSQASPDTGNTVNTFDAAGNLLTQTDAKNQLTRYAYDALNRVNSITFQDGSKQTYGYDQGANGRGRLTSITETNPQSQVTSLLAYAYDQHGRTTSETRTINGVAYVLGYSYDTAGRLNGMTYPSGRTIAYGFDALGRINQVSTTPQNGAQQLVASAIAYQPFGGVKSYTLGNGQSYARGFDLDGRIAGYNLGTQSFAIGYDAASRIRFITDAANPANTNTYDYDNLDRLTSAVLPNLPFAYGYDAVGNRTLKTVGSATDTYTYGTTSNRLASITPQAGATRTFNFDPNGSTGNDGINQYAYDTRGRMVQSTGALGATAYQVNALGQRIRKTNTTEDRVYLYDTHGRLIAETDPGGGLRREYLYLNDIPLVVFQ
jgi:YD repeat-containing protein